MPKLLVPAAAALLALLALLPSCSTGPLGAAPPASYAAASAIQGEGPDEANRKQVRTGSQAVEVNDVQVAVRETTAIVKTRKGFVESSTVREKEDANLQLRVPAAALDPTLEAIAALGKETLRHVSVDDVTKQYIDLEAELTNLRALRSRLRTLLGQAKTVKEALEVEKELARVQTRIDSLQSQLATLKSQVSYSRISLSLERKSIPGPVGLAAKAVALSVKKLWVIR